MTAMRKDRPARWSVDRVSVVDIHLVRVRAEHTTEQPALFIRYDGVPTADGITLQAPPEGLTMMARVPMASVQSQLSDLPRLAALFRASAARTSKFASKSHQQEPYPNIAADDDSWVKEAALLATVYDQPDRCQRDLALRVLQAGFTGSPQQLLAALDGAVAAPQR